MLIRFMTCALVAGATVLTTAREAQAQQTLNLSLGGFVVRGEDARTEGDVINANRTFLAFDVSDFNSASIGGEWLVPLGEYLEGGAGVSFSRRTVASVYADFIDNDGSEIDQDLRLRLVPIAFTVRVLPLGQRNALQPYFGAGLGVFNWRYSESGEFVDFGRNFEIIRDSYVAEGNETGPVILGGLRFGGETWSAGGEIRYHSAEADLDERFAGSKIDLGGWTYNFTVGVRFGR
jgi:hypothetical protein